MEEKSCAVLYHYIRSETRGTDIRWEILCS